MLGSAVNIVMEPRLIQLLAQLVDHQFNVFFPLGPLHAHFPGYVLVALRVDVAQGQILQFLLDSVHAQAVGQGRVNIQGFLGNGDLPVRGLIFQRAHIVQPVRQLDQNHPDILAHGQDHFAKGLRLLLLPVRKVQLIQLRHAVHQAGHLVPKLILDRLQGHVFAVLHRIVQKRRGNGGGIHHQFCNDAGHINGVHKIGLPAFPGLARVGLLREMVRLFDERAALAVRVKFLDPCQHILQS